MFETQGGKAVESGNKNEDLFEAIITNKYKYPLIKKDISNFIKKNNGIFIFKNCSIQIETEEERTIKPDFIVAEIYNGKIINIVNITEVKSKESQGSDKDKYLPIGYKIKFILDIYKEETKNVLITIAFGGLLNLEKYKERVGKSKVAKVASIHECKNCLKDAFVGFDIFLPGKNIEIIFI